MAHMKSVEDIRQAQELLNMQVEEFLRFNGWKHTSSTPGCYWMWQKEIDGILYCVDEDSAINVEYELDEREKWKRGKH